MELATAAVAARMLERTVIVLGGILSIYLGYKLFFLGIENSQGEASAFGITLKSFGPGLFFAALGAFVLVTTMRAAIKVNPVSHPGAQTSTESSPTVSPQQPQADPQSTAIFFGMEDPSRQQNSWAPLSFFLETRQLLRRLENNEAVDTLKDLRLGLTQKLDSITMTDKEYAKFQDLTSTIPLNETDQQELIRLEKKLFPYQGDDEPG